MPLTLRPYQQEAVDRITQALAAGQHPVVSIATGGGKSLIAATLAAQRPGRTLIVTHRQELLEQNGAELLALAPYIATGFYSAGLGRRDTTAPVIFGGIQSIYRQMPALQAAGAFATIIVDEAHAVAPRSHRTMYTQVFAACPQAQRVGLSATPYRLDNGPIFGTPDCWFDTLAYEATISQLTPDYLAPLRGVLTAAGIDTSQVRVRAGEFVESELSAAACEEEAVEGATTELIRVGATRQAWIVFCVDVAHTEMVTAVLQHKGVDAACVTGATPAEERADLLARMQAGTLRALVNCEVATTGFNIRRIDLVAMLRPTMSKGLCVQMLGRGCRHFPGKQDCLVLDFAGNLSRHKPLDGIPVVGRTQERIAKDNAQDEAREAKERESKHGQEASLEDPFGTVETPWYPVRRMTARVLLSKNPKYQGKALLQVQFHVPTRPGAKWVSDFLCLEYDGYPQRQAHAWLRRHGWRGMLPRTVREALAHWGTLEAPTAIQIGREGKWEKVLREEARPRQSSLWAGE